MAKRRVYRWLTPENRRVIEERLADGVALSVIASGLGCHVETVRRAQRDAVVRRQLRRSDSGFRLSIEDRIEIAMRVAAGESNAEIARGLGWHRSTIGREIARCGKRRGHYAPFVAERRARRLARRPKVSKFVSSPRLLAAVEAGLLQDWSPQQIAAWLKASYPDDVGMHVSHETIYQSLYVQARGELRRELTVHLRSKRRRRKPQGQPENRGRIAGMVSIAERPPEVDDRRVPGHWEGDLIVGSGHRSAIMTLVERQTRYVLLARLEDQTTVHVTDVLAKRIAGLPEHLVKSLTWDQGREMTAHKHFSEKTGIQVYFCDPASPWQRGSNENTNGLLRQYLPKSSDLSEHTQADLDQIAAQLNRRPRQTLGWWNPAEKLAELLGEEVHPFPA
jgi:IS30 family transposase